RGRGTEGAAEGAPRVAGRVAEAEMSVAIRRYADADHAAVRDLFIRVNRELAPPEHRSAFESYIARSLTEEIDRLAEYYSAKDGAFFVVHEGETFAGMFGLEGLGTRSAE